MFRREKGNFKFSILNFKIALITVSVLIFSTLGASVKAQNGSLYLSPSSGTVSVGQTFSLVLRVNTGGTAINAAEGSIVFDQSKLMVLSVSKSGSLFTIWASEPEFSNSEGTIEFAGGVPNPGYSGSNGLVLTINFRARAAGSSDITVISGGILANDGYGTNILSSLGKASYVISPSIITPAPVPGEPEVGVPTAPRVNVTSPTHPDSNKWYSNKNPLFKWDVPSGVSEVILVLSRRATSVPFVSYAPPISERLLDDLGEGEWYLNARFRTTAGLGQITSFKFNVDTEPPGEFDITRLDTSDPTNPRPELLFESTDETSGIEHYELSVNGGEAIEIPADKAGVSYAMPLQTPGDKDIAITAFDRAGNSTLARLNTKIESIEVPRLEKVSAEVRQGRPLIVEGTAKPNQKVLIYVIHENGNINFKATNTAYAQLNTTGAEKIYEVTAGADGRFILTITDLSAGNYKIYAKAQDERGAISGPSNDMPAKVRGGILDSILRVFDWFIRILSGQGFFIAFLLALIGLILALIELIKLHAGKNIRKFLNWILVKMARKKSIQKVRHMIKDMEDELGYLKKIEKRRSLNTEEKYLKTKISSYLKMLRHIDKEVHNKD